MPEPAGAEEPAGAAEPASTPDPADTPEEPAPPAPIPPEVTDYLNYKAVEQGRALTTVSSYRLDLAAYCLFLKDHNLDLQSASAKNISGYMRLQQTLGRAPASVFRSLVAIRGLHRYMAVENLRTDDPAKDVEVPKVPRSLPKPLTEAETQALLSAVEGQSPTAWRDRAMLEVLYGAGLRVSELIGLSLGDIDTEQRLMRVLGKGSKERVLPIGKMAFQALRDWFAPTARGAMEPRQWNSSDDAASVFLNRFGRRMSRQGAWGVVKKHGLAAGVGSKLSPHTLRHSFATHMMDHGADVRTLQELLGHASVGTTQIYTQVSVARLRSVYETSHPRALG